MPEVTLVDAINLALARALADDPNVVVFGEDVGVNGGVFRATAGLQQRFGVERVFDTPLSEALIQGTITTRPAFIEVFLGDNKLFYRPVDSKETEGVLLYENS